MPLRCRRCGAIHSDELEARWGQTKETSGYGADPMCIAIVEDPRTGAGAVCAGRLVDSNAAVTERLTALDGSVIHAGKEA